MVLMGVKKKHSYEPFGSVQTVEISFILKSIHKKTRIFRRRQKDENVLLGITRRNRIDGLELSNRSTGQKTLNITVFSPTA